MHISVELKDFCVSGVAGAGKTRSGRPRSASNPEVLLIQKYQKRAKYSKKTINTQQKYQYLILNLSAVAVKQVERVTSTSAAEAKIPSQVRLEMIEPNRVKLKSINAPDDLFDDYADFLENNIFYKELE